MRARAVGSATGVPDRPWLAGHVCAPLSRRHGTAVQASHGTAYPTGFARLGAARQNAVISLSRPTYSASAFPPRERCGPDRACVPPTIPRHGRDRLSSPSPTHVPSMNHAAVRRGGPRPGRLARPTSGALRRVDAGGGSRPWDPRSTTRRKPDGAPATADSKGARDVSSSDISEAPKHGHPAGENRCKIHALVVELRATGRRKRESIRRGACTFASLVQTPYLDWFSITLHRNGT
jgi:hypothetical protein